MAVTIQKIAELSGVSRGTVDRVLHGRPNVNPMIREKVVRVAEKLGYQPPVPPKSADCRPSGYSHSAMDGWVLQPTDRQRHSQGTALYRRSSVYTDRAAAAHHDHAGAAPRDGRADLFRRGWTHHPCREYAGGPRRHRAGGAERRYRYHL